MERPKIKHKPAPMTHQKLMKKQNILMQKIIPNAAVPLKGQKVQQAPQQSLISRDTYPLLVDISDGLDPFDTLQLDDNAIQSFTLGELEMKAEKFVVSCI